VPGTDLTPERRARTVSDLTLAGWLLLGGTFGFIAFQLERVRDVGEQPFAGVWDQRIEVLSFLVLPPNLVVLAPAALVAATATWLAGTERGPWLTALLRAVAGVAITFAVIGVVSILSIAARDDTGPNDVEGIFLRLGGVAMAAGLTVLCRTADRSATE
jgi:MFS family permease